MDNVGHGVWSMILEYDYGVWNMEQLDPDAFMADMNRYGLQWKVIEDPDFDLL